MKVLITGANSLLGANVTDELLKAGYTVKAMVRRKDSMPFTRERLEVYEGSILQCEAAKSAVAGCEVIVHLAANTSQRAQSYASYTAVNVQGTRHMLEAAEAHGVRRFIYVSSANTVGYGSIEVPGTETDAMRDPFTRSGYARSKKEAEDLVLQVGAAGKMEVMVVNPCFLIGAYDTRPSSGKILLRALGKRIVWVPPGGKNFISARDAATAIVRAITRGETGERYLLAGENRSYEDFYKCMRSVSGDRFRIVVIPACILKAIGTLGSIAAYCGMPNAFHLNNIRILCVNNFYSARKATCQLELSVTPLSVTITEALGWFRNRGV